MAATHPGLRIDLGCGLIKKEGTLGIDIQSLPTVDYVLDIENQPLPFAERSVAYAHSSHFLEHILNPDRVFFEVSRVCADQAQLEFWTPYAWSSSAFAIDHRFFFAEEIYMHICVRYVDHWTNILKARWILREFQYVIEPEPLCYLRRCKIDLDFALRHLRDVVKEFCAHITVLRDDLSAPSPPFRRTFSVGDRFAPRYEIKETKSSPPTDSEVQKAIRAYARGGMLPPA